MVRLQAKRRLGRRATPLLAIVVLLGLAGALPTARVNAQAAPDAVVEAFTAAMNQGDVDAAVALFAADGVRELANQTFVGHAEIRTDLANVIAAQQHVTNVSINVIDGTASVVQEIRNPRIAAVGIDRIIRLATYEIADGLITRQTQAPDLTDPETARWQMMQMAGGGGGMAGSGGMAGGGGMAGQGPAGLPSTGNGGIADTGRPGDLPVALALIAVTVAIAAGFLPRRAAPAKSLGRKRP